MLNLWKLNPNCVKHSGVKAFCQCWYYTWMWPKTYLVKINPYVFTVTYVDIESLHVCYCPSMPYLGIIRSAELVHVTIVCYSWLFIKPTSTLTHYNFKYCVRHNYFERLNLRKGRGILWHLWRPTDIHTTCYLTSLLLFYYQYLLLFPMTTKNTSLTRIGYTLHTSDISRSGGVTL